MTRLTKNTLGERKIYNEHGLASLQDEPKVWVSFSPSDKWVTSGWRVCRIGHNNQAFYNWGQKDKEEKRLVAIAWAGEKYGIVEWERSPFGSYHPKGTLDRAASVRRETE